MHYGNGDPIKVGDLAVFVESDGQQTIGIVTRLMPSCGATCNVQIMPVATSDPSVPGLWFPIAGQYGWYKTAANGWPVIAKVMPG